MDKKSFRTLFCKTARSCFPESTRSSFLQDFKGMARCQFRRDRTSLAGRSAQTTRVPRRQSSKSRSFFLDFETTSNSSRGFGRSTLSVSDQLRSATSRHGSRSLGRRRNTRRRRIRSQTNEIYRPYTRTWSFTLRLECRQQPSTTITLLDSERV